MISFYDPIFLKNKTPLALDLSAATLLVAKLWQLTKSFGAQIW